MDDQTVVDEIDPEKVGDDLHRTWDEILIQLSISDYSYKIYKLEDFDYPDNSDYDPDKGEIVPNTMPPVSLGFIDAVSIVYNGYVNYQSFRVMLMNLGEKYKSKYLFFIDANMYSVGERTKYFLEKLEEIKFLKKDIFFHGSGHKNTKLIPPQNSKTKWFDDNEFPNLIDAKVAFFQKMQYNFLLWLETMLQHTAIFINGRLSPRWYDDKSPKLNFNLSRAELTILLMALRDSEIINCNNESQLAAFAEQNFQAKGFDLSSLRATISKFATQENNPEIAFKAVKEKLLKIKIIYR